MSTTLLLTVDEWMDKYRPLINHLDENASWQNDEGRGIMFETYGQELEFVRECNPECVWTYLDVDNHPTEDDQPVLVSGFQSAPFIIGYFVTQQPLPSELSAIVVLD